MNKLQIVLMSKDRFIVGWKTFNKTKKSAGEISEYVADALVNPDCARIEISKWPECER